MGNEIQPADVRRFVTEWAHGVRVKQAVDFVEQLLLMGAVFAAGLHVGVKSGFQLTVYEYQQAGQWILMNGIWGAPATFAQQTFAIAILCLLSVAVLEIIAHRL